MKGFLLHSEPSSSPYSVIIQVLLCFQRKIIYTVNIYIYCILINIHLKTLFLFLHSSVCILDILALCFLHEIYLGDFQVK